MIKKLLAISLLFTGLGGSAQDIHLSQFNNSPLLLNPANTGAFRGKYRFVANQRRQWTEISTPVPYSTFGFAADANGSFGIPTLGTGLSIFNDVDGDSQFSTTNINLSTSYKTAINQDSTWFIGAGVQAGITLRSIVYDDLSFDQQYNGTYYHPDFDNGENFANNGRNYANVQFGAVSSYYFDEINYVQFGVAAFNLLAPDQTFFEEVVNLDRRFTIHMTGEWALNQRWHIVPAFQYMTQGEFSEFDLGARVKYVLNPKSFEYIALSAGGWFRTSDAGFLTIGFDYKDWFAGISYDINYSDLQVASNGAGGLEFSLIKIIQFMPPQIKHHKYCPDWL